MENNILIELKKHFIKIKENKMKDDVIKICVIDEYNNTFYINCSKARDLIIILDELDFNVYVQKYESYYFKHRIEKCDYVLSELVY